MTPNKYVLQEYLRSKPVIDIISKIFGDGFKIIDGAIRGDNTKDFTLKVQLSDLENWLLEYSNWYLLQAKELRDMQPDLLAPYTNEEIIQLYSDWSEATYCAAWINPSKEKILKAVKQKERTK